MKISRRDIVYFNEPGPDNADVVIEIVCQRVKEGGCSGGSTTFMRKRPPEGER